MAAQFDSATIWIQAFIPMASVPTPTGSCFSGDDRGFSDDYGEWRYRARSEVTISGFLSGEPQEFDSHQVGETHRVDCETLEVLAAGYADTDNMSFHGFAVGSTYPDPEGGVVDNPNAGCANILYDGVTNNPLIFSPDIDIALFFTVDPENRTVSVRGAVNAFPDYEAYVAVDGGPSVALFRHAHSLDPAAGLPGGADQKVSATVTV